MATNLVHILDGTTIVWTDSGGDEALDLGGLGVGAVRAGDIADLGSGSRAEWHRWSLIIDGFNTTPQVNEGVDLYMAFSHTGVQADTDGDLSGTDGASSTVVLPNLMPLGSAIVQTTTAANELIISGIMRILHRYVIPVVHNNTGDVLLSTADAHKFFLTPMPIQIQAAV